LRLRAAADAGPRVSALVLRELRWTLAAGFVSVLVWPHEAFMWIQQTCVLLSARAAWLWLGSSPTRAQSVALALLCVVLALLARPGTLDEFRHPAHVGRSWFGPLPRDVALWIGLPLTAVGMLAVLAAVRRFAEPAQAEAEAQNTRVK